MTFSDRSLDETEPTDAQSRKNLKVVLIGRGSNLRNWAGERIFVTADPLVESVHQLSNRLAKLQHLWIHEVFLDLR